MKEACSLKDTIRMLHSISFSNYQHFRTRPVIATIIFLLLPSAPNPTFSVKSCQMTDYSTWVKPII
uniref:Uncharacterized protein n=1 Tax=Onchocerca volvulus TaxID=6282 RepID=A0A8R1TJN7_ONCVO